MRCNASPTTCSAVSALESPPSGIPRAGIDRTTQGEFEALLFAQALKPIAATMGLVGELVVDTAAQRLFAPELSAPRVEPSRGLP